MEKRDYYTISEIFLGLKDYLSEGNKILHELHDLIDIKSDVPYKTYIHINQQTATNFLGNDITYKDGATYKGTIFFNVFKSGFTPARAIRSHQTMFKEDRDPRYSIDNADFIIRVDGDEVTFQKRHDHDIPKTYRPELKIKDTKKFLELYQRLIDEGYISYPDIMYFLPDDLSGESAHFIVSTNKLSIDRVDIMHSDILDRALIFRCDLYNNKIYYRDWRKKPNKVTFNDLLQTKIKKSNIYEGYIPYIEEYINSKPPIEQAPTDKKSIKRLLLTNENQTKRTN